MKSRGIFSYLWTYILLSVFTVLIFASGCKPDQKKKIEAAGSAGREEYMEWFREAKFGMFIHWGPYSMLAGEWNGKQVAVGRNAEWAMKYLQIPVKEYRELSHRMNPVSFNAKEWVQLAKETGMKYLVITAKHHDGFAMYDSKVTDYNITDWTPFKRDPIKELSEECARAGIKFCVYYSHREDWDHPGGYGNNWDYDNDWGEYLFNREKFEKYLEEKAKPQLRELLSNYGPIGLVWFDRGMYTVEQGMEFVNLVHELQPACLTNSRVGNYNFDLISDYQSMSDNGMPPGGLDEYWETPQTLNQTWGFSKFDTLWKSPETVIQRLVEIISRGGNYLLNIGPTGEGKIPDATVNIFRIVGPWVRRNAESIYGTSPNPFPELPWGYATVRGNTVYLFVRDWPSDGKLLLAGLNNKVRSVKVLVDKSIKLGVSQAESVVITGLPSDPPDNPMTVLSLEIEDRLSVEPSVVIQDNTGKVELNYLKAITHGKAKTRFNRKGGFHISKWTNPDDQVEWVIQVDRPGIFKVIVDYSAGKEWEGKKFGISIGTFSLRSTVINTGDWYEYQQLPAGYIEISKPGKYVLNIHPLARNDSYLMYLRTVTMLPSESKKQAGWVSD